MTIIENLGNKELLQFFIMKDSRSIVCVCVYIYKHISPLIDNELLEVRDWVLTLQSSLYLQVLSTVPSTW